MASPGHNEIQYLLLVPEIPFFHYGFQEMFSMLFSPRQHDTPEPMAANPWPVATHFSNIINKL